MKIIKSLFVLLFFISLASPVNASTDEIFTDPYVLKSSEEIDIEYEVIMNNYIESLPTTQTSTKQTRVPTYYKYDYVKIASETKWPIGYPGSQPSKGWSFPSEGGSVCWVDTNGPTMSVSFTWLGVSINLGNMVGISSICANFPANTNYYKVKVKREVIITKTAVYGYPTSGGSRVFLYYVYPQQFPSVQPILFSNNLYETT